MFRIFFFFLLISFSLSAYDPALYYWQTSKFINFGDYLSLEITERILDQPIEVVTKVKSHKSPKMLGVGSILRFAEDGDVVWGTGVSGKTIHLDVFSFSTLNVKSVRGPVTRQFLLNRGIECPEVYGDPVLLFPYLFPEYQRKENPEYDYIVIPHYSERPLFPKTDAHVVHPTDNWEDIVKKILNSKFVIASSLHGIVLAEAYGIPARMLRVTDNEPLLKYEDYYLGTGRTSFEYATSIEEALAMGGEKPFICNLKRLYDSFPFEYWNSIPHDHNTMGRSSRFYRD